MVLCINLLFLLNIIFNVYMLHNYWKFLFSLLYTICVTVI